MYEQILDVYWLKLKLIPEIRFPWRGATGGKSSRSRVIMNRIVNCQESFGRQRAPGTSGRVEAVGNSGRSSNREILRS